MSTSKEIVLVTGATGKIGTAFVHRLASDAARPTVRVATRDVNSPAASLLRAFNPATVQLVHFDETDPSSLQAAFSGVTKLFIVAPFVADMTGWHTKVIEAALAAGTCEYVVKVSVTGARSPENDPPPGRIPLSHWQGEEAIRRSGLPATMIRPTIFMQHFLTVPGLYSQAATQFYLPTGAAGVAFVDCRDIATFAASILRATPAERQPYQNQAFELTGPAAVSAADIAAMLSAVASRKIEHKDGEEAFVARCKELGIADGVKAVYAEAAEGWFSKVEDEAYSQIVGSRPTSFAKFAFDHAYYFRPFGTRDNS